MSEGYSTTILKTDISAEHIVDYSICAMFKPDTVGTIDWGDGTTTEASGSEPVSHTYAAAGKYTIRIHGIHMLFMAGYDTKSIVFPDEQMQVYHSVSERAYSTLEEVTFNEGLNDIYHGAFSNCTLIKSITIPSTVTEMGDRAFEDCTGLKTVYCNAVTPPSWWIPGTGTPDPFEGCTGLTAIYVPKEAVNAYKSAAGWSTYANIIRRYPMTTVTERIANITIDSTEEVTFKPAYPFYAVKGEGVKATLIADIADDATQGVYSTDNGNGYTIIKNPKMETTLYLTGTGDISVWGGENPEACPFV